MPDTLLPLNALMEPLRGFLAVDSHMSVTRAAQELCFTQWAVSRQVQALERRPMPSSSALREPIEQVMACGTFGAPMFFVGGAMYWGNGRLDDAWKTP